MVIVSIIVPVYNAAEKLKRCIDSIINQTFKNIEIILINDGSTDKSGEVCEYYKEKDNRIIVVHTENRGSGEARNKGLNVSTGEYIYFCDPDDWIESNLVEKCYNKIIERNSDLVIFGVNNYINNSKMNKDVIKGKRRLELSRLNGVFKDDFIYLYNKGLATSVWNKFFKKSFIIENNSKFPAYSKGQDFSFMMSIYKNLLKVTYIDECLYNYVKYKNNTAVTRYNPNKFDCNIKLHNELIGLISYWNVNENKYKEIIDKFLFEAIFDELYNILHNDNKDTWKEKNIKCFKLLNNEVFNNSIKSYKNMRGFNGFIAKCINNGHIKFSILLLKSKVTVRNIFL